MQLRITRREFGTDSIAAKESLLLRCAIPNSSNQPTVLAEAEAKTDPPTTGNRTFAGNRTESFADFASPL